MNKIRGIVVSYVTGKRYGFIKEDDGESYFFHASKLINPHDEEIIVRDVIVVFEAVPTKKGLSAIDIEVISSLKSYDLNPFFITKSSKPRKGVISRSVYTRTHYFKSANEGKDYLKLLVGAIGGNCVLDFQHHTQTLSHGNYLYTAHSFSGTVALNFSEISVVDENKKVELDEEYARCCREFDSRYKKVIAEQKQRFDSQFDDHNSLALRVIMLFIFIIAIAVYFSS